MALRVVCVTLLATCAVYWRVSESNVPKSMPLRVRAAEGSVSRRRCCPGRRPWASRRTLSRPAIANERSGYCCPYWSRSDHSRDSGHQYTSPIRFAGTDISLSDAVENPIIFGIRPQTLGWDGQCSRWIYLERAWCDRGRWTGFLIHEIYEPPTLRGRRLVKLTPTPEPIPIMGPRSETFAIRSPLAHQIRNVGIRTDSERRSGCIDCFAAVRVPFTLHFPFRPCASNAATSPIPSGETVIGYPLASHMT